MLLANLGKVCEVGRNEAVDDFDVGVDQGYRECWYSAASPSRPIQSSCHNQVQYWVKSSSRLI